MYDHLKMALLEENLGERQRAFFAQLERRTRLPIEPVAIPSYAGIYAAMEAREVQLAWAPPMVALDLCQWEKCVPLAAVVRGGLTSYPAVLVARRDSSVRVVGDVACRQIAWVSRLSVSGYVMPRLFLEANCRMPLRLLREQRLVHSHEEVLREVIEGRCEVGATYARLACGDGVMTLPGDANELRIVAVTGFVPSEMILAGPGVSALDRLSLADGLRRLSTQELAMLGAGMGVERLSIQVDHHLDPLRRLVEQGRVMQATQARGSVATRVW